MAEEKEEKEEKPKEKVKKFSLADVPTRIKVISVIVIFYLYTRSNTTSSELLLAGGGVFLLWYFTGKDVGKEKDVLSPQEAYTLLKTDIEKRKETGRIPKFTKVYIDNDGLKHHNAMPDFYIFGLEYQPPYANTEFKRAIVSAVGNTKGYVTIQDSNGRTTGTEVIPSKVLVPPWIKTAEK